MDLSQFDTMDSHILLSIVNEQLRIECDNLPDFLTRFDIPKQELEQKMSDIGYQYDGHTNQFKAK